MGWRSRINLVTLYVILSIVGICCSPSSNDDPAKYSDALIVIKGAQDLHYSNFHGTDQLFYKIKTHYPAKQEINEIYEKLEAKGWKPLKEDYLNPGLPTSHVKGWGNFIEGVSQVHQWLAQWENNNKDILVCALRYSYPGREKADLNNLEVYLIFISSKLVIENKKSLLEYNIQNKKANTAN